MTEAAPTTAYPAARPPRGGNFGKIAGALAVGAVAGFAANQARKLATQAPSIAAGSWVEALKAEHRAVEKLFDALLATPEDAAIKRNMLLGKIAYALTRHAVEEENIVYPALKRDSPDGRAAELVDDHSQIKTIIFELKEMKTSDPQWIVRAQALRDLIDRHIREEEDEIFPALESSLSKEENSRLTMLMNWEGYKVA